MAAGALPPAEAAVCACAAGAVTPPLRTGAQRRRPHPCGRGLQCPACTARNDRKRKEAALAQWEGRADRKWRGGAAMRGAGPGAALLAWGSWAGPLPLRPLLPSVPRRGFAATLVKKSYDVRRVDITPLEQRKVTFDTHALVQDLEAHGFGKEQAETIVSALITLSNVSLDTVYKDMVTQAQQEITLQQIMAHLDSIRKDMVILEKSEFANLRAENEKMKIELDQVKQQLMNETGKIRADSKLDINLERSRVTDMFTDQERKLMEATTDFHKKLQYSLA
ncbi:coiled-coil domain-containing protein 90B, mitochondrial isoform 2-T3 [Alca torda]